MGQHSASKVRSARTRQKKARPPLQVERLEDRRLLAAAVPDLTIAPLLGNGPAGGLSVPQIRHAYGFDAIAWGAARGDGAGQTIALVVAGDYPTIVGDLQYFDRTFGLPDPPAVHRVGPQGTPAVDPTWALEAALDVEWAHAIAPGANILLVEARSSGMSDMLNAMDWARQVPDVSVVSLSWGTSEFSVEGYYDGHFTAPAGHNGITFVAASGDNGARAGASWPAISTNVLSVGGTRLNTDPWGNYLGETAWSGSGGAQSLYVGRPAYQNGYQGTAMRTGPDVAYDADSATGFAVFTSIPYSGRAGWFSVGGTSAGSPQWAGIIAVANQGRALAGLPALSGVQNEIYQMPATNFHDVTQGSNGYSAGPGYDLVTGRGSPYADRVVYYLVSSQTTASPTPGLAARPTSNSTTTPSQRSSTTRFAVVADDGEPAANGTAAPWAALPTSSAAAQGTDLWFASGQARRDSSVPAERLGNMAADDLKWFSGLADPVVDEPWGHHDMAERDEALWSVFQKV